METVNKSSVMGMVAAAVVAVTLTWSMSHAFVESTAVARWVDAADLAGGAVARVADTGAAKAAATSLLK
jgi:hypothetical protein